MKSLLPLASLLLVFNLCFSGTSYAQNLQIYRIDYSVWGQLVRWLKPPPLPSVTSFNMSSNMIRNYEDYFRKNSYVLSDEEEVKRFKDPRGYELIEDTYYIRHPKRSQTNWLISAKDFHAFVIKEQMSEIVSYLRAELPVKKITFIIKEGASFDVLGKADIPGEPIKLEGGANGSTESKDKFTLECKRPLRPSEKRRQYIWIDDFPLLKAAVDGFEGGTLTFEETSNLEFGMSVEVAKSIGIKAKFNRQQIWSLKVEVF